MNSPSSHRESLCFVPRSDFERVLALEVAQAQKVALFADLARINTLYMIALAGSGHIGSSFSSLDIVSWLFLGELRAEDVYFSSKGHDAPALYAVLCALGVLPFQQLHELRRLGGLPGHPDVGTKGIATNTGSLGMGISKAKGMAAARRLQGRRGRFYVMTGDGELQEGQIWESLLTAARDRLSEITVIVDHNQVQSDIWVESTSPLGDLEAKFESFGWHVTRCDGHDPDALAACLESGRDATDRPKVIIADTVKGRGVSFMESTAMEPDQILYRFHSGAPDAESYRRAVAELTDRCNDRLRRLGCETLDQSHRAWPERPSPVRPERLIEAYSQTLLELGHRHPELVVLDADLVLDCGLIPFRQTFPDRFIECGIAEQDMVSQAGGLALEGLLPVVHSFACFLSTRANEQFYNNATEHTKIIYTGSLAGLVPAGPGHSHQSVRDISALAAVPDLVLIEPCCELETRRALEWAVDSPTSTYLRLVSIPCEIPYQLPEDHFLQLGRGTTLRDGADVLVIGYGPVLLSEAFRAATTLAGRGIGVRLVALPWLNRVDEDWLAETVHGFTHVVTLDNHFVAGGQGEFLAARLAAMGTASGLEVSAIGLREVPRCGLNHEVLRFHRLDSASLAEDIRNQLGAPR